jgi:hypothetical protein
MNNLNEIQTALRHLTNLQPILANGLLTKEQLKFIDPHIDIALMNLRQALEDAEKQANSIWVLTEEVSDYDQYGEYFVGAWNKKPTHQMLSALGVPQNRLRHVLNGGGRVGYEGAWFFLKEIEHVG